MIDVLTISWVRGWRREPARTARIPAASWLSGGQYAQESEFYDLNQLLVLTNPAQAITDLITVLYPSSAPPIDPSAVPCG